MSEKLLLVNGLQFTYEGIFIFNDLIDFINKCLAERGYKRHEKEFKEAVSAEGKNIFIELRPVRTRTAYFSNMMKIMITIENIKETTIDVDNIPVTFQNGRISMTFDAYNTTDYENRWGMNPVKYFLKAFINKYVYRWPLEKKLSGEVVGDVHYVFNQTKAHLNLHRYKAKTEHSE